MILFLFHQLIFQDSVFVIFSLISVIATNLVKPKILSLCLPYFKQFYLYFYQRKRKKNPSPYRNNKKRILCLAMASSTTPRALDQIVRDGLSSLVFAFGYQSGIVDAFINVQQPCTADELSQKAGKKLR